MDSPASLDRLPTPALLLDLDTLDANLRRMARRCERLEVALRPHVKTHKCPEVGRMQRDHGARGITVSTLAEGRAFADAGFDDLTWAFPFIPSRAEEAAALARRVRLGVTVDSPRALEAMESVDAPFRVWLKVDSGYGRAGVDPGSDEALALARAIAAREDRFAGILTHSGHAYRGRTPEAIAAAVEEERLAAVGLAERCREAGLPVPAVSVGSTPGLAHARTLEGCTEARPGNYALYDHTQVLLASCGVEDCAATVLSTVVSHRPGAARSVIDAGALALSKDTGPEWGPGGYGPLLDVGQPGEPPELDREARVVSVSQEHGIVDAPLPVGARVRILPNHSCLTVACFDEFQLVRGGRVVGRWRIRRERS